MTRRQVLALAAFLLLLISPPGVASQSKGGDRFARGGVPLPHGELIEKFGPPSSPSPESDMPITEEQQTLERPPSPPALARLAEDRRTLARSEGGPGAWRFWDALPLLAVLAMIGAIALVLKRFMPARRLLTGAGVLDIVARTPLSGKQSLVLVKMGRRLILLGISPDRVRALDVVDDPDQVATLLGEAAGQKPDSMSAAFADTFRQEAHAYVEEPVAQNAAIAARGHVQGLLEKVRRLTRGRDVA